MLDPNAKCLSLAMLLGPTLAQHGRITPAEFRRAAAIVRDVEEWALFDKTPDDPTHEPGRVLAQPASLSTVMPSPTHEQQPAPRPPSNPSQPSDAQGRAVTLQPVARADVTAPVERFHPQLRHVIAPPYESTPAAPSSDDETPQS